MKTKTCKICKIDKEISCFSINKSKKDGFHYNCKLCDSEKVRNWYNNNKEKASVRRKEYKNNNKEKIKNIEIARYAKNKEKILNDRKKYYAKNKKLVIARVLSWSNKNIDKKRMYLRNHYNKNKIEYLVKSSRRRAGIDMATPSWLSAIELAQIQEMYDIAAAKRIQTGIDYHVDHICPLNGKNVMGLHVPWNLQVITKFENLSKGNRIVCDYAFGFEG